MSEQNKQIVERLLPFLVEKQDLSGVAELICPHVISHMDQYNAHGLQTWTQWVRFLNSRKRVQSLETILDGMLVHSDESVTAYGKWRARRQGKVLVSDKIAATYKIQDGKIVEIWTKRTNYTFVIGPLMQSSLGLILVLLYFKVWCVIHPLAMPGQE